MGEIRIERLENGFLITSMNLGGSRRILYKADELEEAILELHKKMQGMKELDNRLRNGNSPSSDGCCGF